MSFRIVTYNILADAYIKPSRYPNSLPLALDPTARRALLLDRLRAFQADIYCLQEVEPQAFEDIQAAFQPHGLIGHYEQKHGRPDGSAIFVKTSCFQVQSVQALHYKTHKAKDDQVALIVELLYKERRIAVVSTHLPWQPDKTTEDQHIGLLQLQELIEVRAQLLPQAQAWFIAGDFNAISESYVLRYAQRQGFRISCRKQRPWDTVNINGKRRKLDYILFESDLFDPTPGRLPSLQRDTPMPSLEEPSDHLPLEVSFSLFANHTDTP
ncbi:MAG: endonuclease/exonuclease/phosphatase family protein [Myxococcales bacterium]|nr:endonuclease/exonuclease/phosphatase family protein [Myxococcales bacterium]